MVQYTNGAAMDIIDDDGLSYAVRHYCDGKYFKDPETARLWDEAGGALNDLMNHLIKDTGREDCG